MKTMLIRIIATIAIVMLAAGVLADNPVIATITVQTPTCGLTETGAIDFGSVVPGATSRNPNVTVANNGNVPTTSFAVTGTNWTSTLVSNTTFPAGATQVSEDFFHYFPLQNTTTGTPFGK